MLIYEVNLSVGTDLADEFGEWLGHHLGEMRALEPIRDARLYRTVEPDGGGVEFVAHYSMASRADYDRYLEQYAERMRADGMRRFGGRFEASRRLLQAD